MGDPMFLLILIFICYMTGIYTPATVVQKGIPSKKVRARLYNGFILFLVMGAGLNGFFNPLGEISLDDDHIPTAFVFVDQSSEETSAVYRVTPTSFGNHLSLQVQNRTETDSGDVALGILLTNQLEKALYINPNYLAIETMSGEKIAPIKSWIAGEALVEEVKLEAGEDIFGTFLFPKSVDDVEFELKYLPIES